MTTIEIKEGDETPAVDETVENAATVAEQAHDQAMETVAVAAGLAAQMDTARKEGEAVERNIWEGFNEVLAAIGEVHRRQDEILSRLDSLESVSVATLGAAAEAADNTDDEPAPELEAAAVAVESAAESVEVAAEVVQEPQERAKPKRRWV